MNVPANGSFAPQDSPWSELNLKLSVLETKHSNFMMKCASLLTDSSIIPATESSFYVKADKHTQLRNQLRTYKSKVNFALKYFKFFKQSIGLNCGEEVLQAVETIQGVVASIDLASVLDLVEREGTRLVKSKRDHAQGRSGKYANRMQSLFNEYDNLSEQMNSVRNSVLDLTRGYNLLKKTQSENRVSAEKNKIPNSNIDFNDVAICLSNFRKEILGLPSLTSEWKTMNLHNLAKCEQQIEMASSQLFHHIHMMQEIIDDYSHMEQYMTTKDSLCIAQIDHIRNLKSRLLHLECFDIISLKNQEIDHLKSTDYAKEYKKLLNEHEHLKELYEKQGKLEKRFKFIADTHPICPTSSRNSQSLKIKIHCFLKAFATSIDSSFNSIAQKLSLIIEKQRNLQLAVAKELKANLNALVLMNEAFSQMLSYKRSLRTIQEEKDYLEYTINQQTEVFNRQTKDLLDTMDLLEIDNSSLSGKIHSISHRYETLKLQVEELENENAHQKSSNSEYLEKLETEVKQLKKSIAEKEFECSTASYEKEKLELYNTQLIDK